nr:retrovirus-related Pol polyprotein from transposon TNT 1-94 [Tanacetum cinerariifolium]
MEENLHIRFSENTPNIVGSGPNLLFDIDSLTKSMTYKPVVARNQSNGNADDGFQPLSDDVKKVDEDPKQESECKDQEKEYNVNNTNNVNVVGTNEVNAVDDDEETDMNNMDTTIQMDVKSAFMYEKIEEEDKYVAEILKKYGFSKVKNSSTPMETQKPPLKDKDCEEVDVYIHRSMIGLMMYLTSSRPDIMFVVCACARYQNDNERKLCKNKKSKLVRKRFKRTDKAVNEKMDDSLEMAATIATRLDAKHDRGNIFKTQSMATPNEPGFQGTSSGGVPWFQEAMGDTVAQTWSERISKISNDLLLAGVNTPRSGDDSLELTELMELCTKLQQRVLDLETTKITQAIEIESLKTRVKKLETRKRSRTYGLKILYKVDLSARVSSKDEGLGEEDTSKLGRIADIDSNEDIYLVNVYKDKDIFGVNDLDGDEVIVEDVEMLFDVADDLRGKEVFVPQEVPLKEVSAIDEVNVVSTATTITAIIDDITLSKALMEIKSAKPKTTAASTRPKAKGLVIREQDQASIPTLKLNEELAFKLQAKKEEEERISKEKAQQIKEVNIAWDDVQAKIDADYELAQKLQAEEQEELNDLEKKAAAEITQEDSLKRAGEEMEQERSKKQKVEDDKDSKELKKCLEIIPDDGDDVTIDATPFSSSSSSIFLLYCISCDQEVMEMIRLSCGIKSQAGFESRPPMLNKENYVPWSSRLLRYAKSRPNGKLIHNSILNGPYVRKMIPEPGDANREITVTETSHLQIDDELSDKELKQIEADDQAIQTILIGLPEDIYAVVDSCETTQEIWLRVQQMMKGSDIVIQEKKANLFNGWERFTSNEGESIESYYHRFLKLMNDLKRNKHFPEKISSNLKFLNNLQPEWSRHVSIVHQTKDLHTTDYTKLYDFLRYNQKEVDELKAKQLVKIQDPLALMANSSNPYAFPSPHQDQSSNMQIAQPWMNMGQDRQMQMVGGNSGNQFRQYAGHNAGNPAGYNDVIGNQVVQNAVQNPRVQNVKNQNGIICIQGNGNQNQIGNGNLVAARAKGNAARQNGNQIRCYNCRGVADLDEIKEVNVNCILMANLQQASTSGTQTDSAPIYDTDGSAEVHENCDNNEIFNMFTQEEQYTKQLEPIPESHQVPQNANNVIFEDTSVEQGGEIVEQHPVNFEETRALYESLYQNLATEVEKVNSVNRKLKETNADLTTKLTRFKNKKDVLKLVKKNMTNLKDLNKHLSKEKSTVSFLLEEKKRHKALELEIERLLKAVVSQDIMIIVQNEYVVDTSDLQTELEHTRNPLSQKLENENVELEYQVLNYARENAHLKATYKNLFDSISTSRAQTKTIISSLQNELQSNIYKNAKLRTQLFKKVSDQKNNTKDTSVNTKFAKQPIVENLPKVGKTNTLSNPVTSNLVSTPQ